MGSTSFQIKKSLHPIESYGQNKHKKNRSNLYPPFLQSVKNIRILSMSYRISFKLIGILSKFIRMHYGRGVPINL